MNWKGGRIFNTQGYVLIMNPRHPFATRDGYVRLHRFVWETHNKACLLPCGAVHHINGIKKDNRIENLQAMMKYQHDSLESKIDMSNRKCFICNSNKTQMIKGKYPKWYNYKGGFLCHRCYKKTSRTYRAARLLLT